MYCSSLHTCAFAKILGYTVLRSWVTLYPRLYYILYYLGLYCTKILGYTVLRS